MNTTQLIARTRSYLRDLNSDTFRQIDVEAYINEAIDRCKQVIPELSGMQYLSSDLDEVIILPEQYQHLLALYSASRCYFQDERLNQANTLMNEFEEKLWSLKNAIQNEDVILLDGDGLPIEPHYVEDFVRNVYFKIRT